VNGVRGGLSFRRMLSWKHGRVKETKLELVAGEVVSFARLIGSYKQLSCELQEEETEWPSEVNPSHRHLARR
jgi:hypothetical protein